MPFYLLVVLPYRWSLIELVGIPYTLEASLKLIPLSVIEFSTFSNDLFAQLSIFSMCVSLPLVAAPARLRCRRLFPRASALSNRHRWPPLVPFPSPIAVGANVVVGAFSAYGRASGPCPARLRQGRGSRPLRCLPGSVVGSTSSDRAFAPAPLVHTATSSMHVVCYKMLTGTQRHQTTLTACLLRRPCVRHLKYNLGAHNHTTEHLIPTKPAP